MSSASASSRMTERKRSLSPHAAGSAKRNRTSDMNDAEELELLSIDDSVELIGFKPPTRLPEKSTLKVPTAAKLEVWWREESDLIVNSFSKFVQQKYFVNKFKFIRTLLNDGGSCTAIFMPTGCGKTVMSISLEYFFSYQIDKEDREMVQPHYKEYFKPDELENHEGTYYVLRLSFRNLRFECGVPFKKTLNEFLKKKLAKLEPNIFKDPKFEGKIDEADFFDCVLDWLHDNHEKKKIIVIIDEMDFPFTTFSIEASPVAIKNMVQDYHNFLVGLSGSTESKNSYLKKVIVFGIHPPPDRVFKSRTWKKLFITNKRTCAPYFLFSREEVGNLLRAYDLEDKLPEVESHYGHYNGDFFLPSSVVTFANQQGEFALYKLSRRSCDILNINMKSIESSLLEFVDNEPQERYIDVNSANFSLLSIANNPFIHYVYAGLLCISFRNIEDSKKKNDPEKGDGEEMKDLEKGDSQKKEDCDYLDSGNYHLFAGNLENRNIIAFFLERMVGLPTNIQDFDEASRALQQFNLMELEETLNNKLFNTFKAIELTSERVYQSAMKVFFHYVPGWITRTEVDEGTGNTQTGASGQSDIRLNNVEETILYIIEVKYAKQDASVTTIENLIKKAYDQIVMKGYVGQLDKMRYHKIYEVAVVGHGKVVTINGRIHESPK